MLQASARHEALLVGIGLAMGLLYLGLHELLARELWPQQAPAWAFAFYTAILTGGVTLLLGLALERQGRVLALTALLALVAGYLAHYTTDQRLMPDSPFIVPPLTGFFLTMTIASFKALMYIQHFASGEPFSYSALFRRSWRNFLTLPLALLFTGVFWGILMLWAGLFYAVDLDFFFDLFTDHWFIYPVTGLAFGFGIVIARRQHGIIDTIAQVQQTLTKHLLPLLALMALLFLLALQFTGLNPLWESGGSALILAMLALLLFFVNAVYKDDPSARPYPLWLHRFIYLGVALLPIYCLFSAYGLALRVLQQGWSINRCWAVLIWALLTLFCVCYCYGIARRRDNWLASLSRINVGMGLVLLAAMLLVNSPLLDFRKISAASQIARLGSGAVTLEEFDFKYFRRHLGRPGYEAIQALKEDLAATSPEMADKIDDWYLNAADSDDRMTRAKLAETLDSGGLAYPEPLQGLILNEVNRRGGWSPSSGPPRHIFPIDLDEDGKPEYLVFGPATHSRPPFEVRLYYQDAEGWRGEWVGYAHPGDLPPDEVLARLRQGDFTLATPSWKQLEVGDHILHPRKPASVPR